MASLAEGEDFFSLVTVEEKDSIPENLGKKLQDVWEQKIKEITNLKVDNEKLRLNSGKMLCWFGELPQYISRNCVYLKIVHNLT